MSEEEIIKEIKQTLETWQHIIDFGYGTIEVPNETKIFKTILNIIEKQQKEIETLKEVDKKICNEELLTQEYVQNNYIRKDKIRNKIKELEEKEKNCHFTGLITECEIKIEVLKELLKEE